jgi:hypothetical protein
MFKRKVKIADVFTATGQPSITYVEREQGRYEAQIRSVLDDPGHICLITGASKTGKTTLYRRILKERETTPIVIRCFSGLQCNEIWLQALEKSGFGRRVEEAGTVNSEQSGSGKVGGSLGMKAFSALAGETQFGIKRSFTSSDKNEYVRSTPSSSHLISILKEGSKILVLEDFHYLNDEIKRDLFQQIKAFTDESITILVLGTTHHAIDLAYANKDLLGRIVQIDVARWSEVDLRSIVDKGFEYLGISLSINLRRSIAQEAVGLPILVQQFAQQLFIDKNISDVKIGHDISFDKSNLEQALHNVALTKYAQLETLYQTFVAGARKQARKYDSYKLLLACFSSEPITFSLSRHEIDERLRRLEIPKEEQPPAASINATLRALQGFQQRREMELLEWRPKESKLYILEPAFLFFVRWREKKSARLPLQQFWLSILDARFSAHSDTVASGQIQKYLADYGSKISRKVVRISAVATSGDLANEPEVNGENEN